MCFSLVNKKVQVEFYFKQQLGLQLRVLEWLQLIWLQPLRLLELPFFVLFQFFRLPQPEP